MNDNNYLSMPISTNGHEFEDLFTDELMLLRELDGSLQIELQLLLNRGGLRNFHVSSTCMHDVLDDNSWNVIVEILFMPNVETLIWKSKKRDNINKFSKIMGGWHNILVHPHHD